MSLYPSVHTCSVVADTRDRLQRRPAFTLIELLVVVGIIAVLIGILIPTLSRAREQANAVACLSNLRQLGNAFVMYTNANKGWLPSSAVIGGNRPQDWIWWYDTDSLDGSAIAPYLGKPNYKLAVRNALTNPTLAKEQPMINRNLFICPSDNVTQRARALGPYIYPLYPFSYSMNMFLGSGQVYDGEMGATYKGLCAARISQIKKPYQKVLLFEEDPGTIDDGNGFIDWPNGDNLLAIRHGRIKKFAKTLDRSSLPFPKERGNVVFCDGSARYVTREEVNTPSGWNAKY